mgnify:CR=1 FL=1
MLPYWMAIMTTLGEITLRDNPCTPGHCLLHWFPHTPKNKITSKFLDLALILAAREITRNWKSRLGPQIGTWVRELIKWASCEGVALMRESKGKNKGSIDKVRAWDALVEDLRRQGETEEGNDE